VKEKKKKTDQVKRKKNSKNNVEEERIYLYQIFFLGEGGREKKLQWSLQSVLKP
jgi:hypothetical protein